MYDEESEIGYNHVLTVLDKSARINFFCAQLLEEIREKEIDAKLAANLSKMIFQTLICLSETNELIKRLKDARKGAMS